MDTKCDYQNVTGEVPTYLCQYKVSKSNSPPSSPPSGSGSYRGYGGVGGSPVSRPLQTLIVSAGATEMKKPHALSVLKSLRCFVSRSRSDLLSQAYAASPIPALHGVSLSPTSMPRIEVVDMLPHYCLGVLFLRTHPYIGLWPHVAVSEDPRLLLLFLFDMNAFG